MIKVASQQQMKQTNAKAVFQLIRENRNMSRAKITKLTKLSPTTISSIVEQLIAQEMVVEAVPLPGSGAGRKAISLEVNPSGKYMIGMEIGPGRVMGTVYNLRNESIVSVSETFASEPEALVRSIRQAVSRLKTAVRDRFDDLMGIGIGLPAMLDADKKTILLSTVLDMEQVRLHEKLQEREEAPVFIEDNTILAATAEIAWMGNAPSPFIYLSIDEGVGASVFTGGQYLQGTNGVMLEIGHMSLDMNGKRCQCGNRGCFELYVSTSSLAAKIEKASIEDNASILSQIWRERPGEPAANVLAEALKSGDSAAGRILSELAAHLGNGIVNLIHIFNPETVVLGGGLAEIGEPLLKGVQERVGERAIPTFRDKCTIRLRNGNGNIVSFGASLYILSKVMDSYFLEL